MTYLPTETSASVTAGQKPARAATGSVGTTTRPDRSQTSRPNLTKPGATKPDLKKKDKLAVEEPVATADHAESFAAPAAGTARVEPVRTEPLADSADDAPEPGRLFGVTVWGLGLTVIGLIVAGCVAMMALTAATGTNLGAALTMVPICGLLGLGLVIASLGTITRGRVPYILLGCATVVLLIFFGVVIAT
ncbi:hypothetical protein [Fodinicola feengrottensis]